MIETVNRDQEMEFMELETMQVDEQPESSTNSRDTRIRSEAEHMMWEDFDCNGAVFDAGADDARDVDRRRLEIEADKFGLWNPEGTARALGFSDPTFETSQDNVDDDVLADIMASAGKILTFMAFQASDGAFNQVSMSQVRIYQISTTPKDAPMENGIHMERRW
jgi:hypothetical protein